MKFDDLKPEEQQEYQREYGRIMWDIEGSTRQYSVIDFLIDGVIAISAVQLIDGTIKSIRGPPKDKDDDKKGPPGGNGENKFLNLFGGDKKAQAEPAKKKIDIDNDIFRR